MATRTQRLGPSWCSILLVVSLGLALAILVGVQIEQEATRPAAWSEPVRLTILHTNDIHGQVLQPPGQFVAGLVPLGRRIRQERDRALGAGESVLLLDAGDLFKGSPEGDLTNGAVVVDWMNHLRYDALVIGNHEFDHGIEVALSLANQASFPFLGANILEEETGKHPAWLGKGASPQVLIRSLIPAQKRPRVAVVGLTTSRMKDMTLAGITDGLTFPDEAETLEGVLAGLPPVDLVVLLTHSGLGVDRKLAERFDGRIHVIVGGHSHTRLPEGERVGDVLIVQAGSRAYWLGRTQITLTPPGRADDQVKITSQADLLKVGDDLEAVLKPHIEEVQKHFAGQVGFLEAPLKKVPGYASGKLGNLQTDLMRKKTGAEVAFQNKTGIRASLPAGALTLRHVYQVSPFGNTVVTMEMTGDVLRDLLEGMLDSPSKLLECSGIRITCDPTLPEGSRLLEATVGGAPIHPRKTYLVATNNFLAGGGDGHEAFTRGAKKKDSQVLLRDLLATFLSENNPYLPVETEQRIVKVVPVPSGGK